jgi:hypothetical protein
VREGGWREIAFTSILQVHLQNFTTTHKIFTKPSQKNTIHVCVCVFVRALYKSLNSTTAMKTLVTQLVLGLKYWKENCMEREPF